MSQTTLQWLRPVVPRLHPSTSSSSSSSSSSVTQPQGAGNASGIRDRSHDLDTSSESEEDVQITGATDDVTPQVDDSTSNRPNKRRKTAPSTGAANAHRFKPKWCALYAWLSYDNITQAMFCKWCKAAGVRSNWTASGVKSCRKHILEEHENGINSKHVHDVYRANLKLSLAKGKQAQKQQLETMSSNSAEEAHFFPLSAPSMTVYQSLLGCFRTLYWLCSKELPPYTTFSDLKRLIQGFGVQFAPAFQEGYESKQSIEEMILCISDSIKHAVRREVKSSPFFALLLDETTDISVRKECCFAVKYLDVDGRPKTTYLSMEVVENGTADCITNAAKDAIESSGFDWKYLVAVGTDGCSTMLGRVNGVVKQLKDVAAHIVNVHCSNHRVALACVDAASDVPFIGKKFKPLLSKLFFYYHHSANRITALEKYRDELDLPNVSIKKPADTRWLSTDSACQALRKVYPAVLKQLAEDSEDEGQGLYNSLRNTTFLRVLLMMCDILPLLTRLQVELQTPNADFAFVRGCVNRTANDLIRLRAATGEYEREYYSLLEQEEYNLITSTTRTRADRVAEEDFADTIRSPYIAAIRNRLLRRFEGMEILSSFSTVFNPSEYPNCDVDELEFASFGDEAIEQLKGHYGARLDTRRLLAQWPVFKDYMKSQVIEKHPTWTTADVLSFVARNQPQGMDSFCSEIRLLARLASVIPMSTADVERYFSALNRVKSIERNRLQNPMLDALLRISIAGPRMDDFDFQPAMRAWYKSTKVKTSRRIKIPELETTAKQ